MPAMTKVSNLQPKPHQGKLLQEIAVSTSAVSFTNDFDIDSLYMLVEVKTASVYVTFDGSTPSATNGHILAAGYREFWSRNQAAFAKFLQNSGAARVIASPFTD
jgi:hypothetical protein